MNRPTNASIFGGLLLMAALSFRGPSVSENRASSGEANDTAQQTSTSVFANDFRDGLPHNEDGPWAAICSYFVSLGTSKTSDLGTNSEPGIETYQKSDLTELRKPIGGSKITSIYRTWDVVSAKFETCMLTVDSQAALRGGGRDLRSTPRTFDRHIKALIAMVPDPLNTSLALDYDRNLESIERAAAAAQYNFDRYWVPWDTSYRSQKEDPAKSLSDVQQLRHRTEQPGVLIFHTAPATGTSYQEPRDLLFVFLVGETPSGGINKVEFTNAVHYIQELKKITKSPYKPGPCSERELRDGDLLIMGPEFSGSLHSLSVALTALHNATQTHNGPLSCVHVNSGTATVWREVKRFKKNFEEQPAHCHTGQDCIWLSTTTYDDEIRSREIVDFFLHKLKYSPGEIAFIEETASGFRDQAKQKEDDQHQQPSSSGRGSQEEVVTLAYPRGIAPLRNAYQAAEEATSKSFNERAQPLISVPPTFRELIGRGQDTIAAMSPEQTAVSQDAVLRQISHTLRQRRIKAAVVFATDNLDALFLLKYLRTANPDIRLAVVNSDLIFIRSGEAVDYTGTLVVTPFPLFGGQAIGRPEITFPTSTSAGVFLATYGLLGAPVQYLSAQKESTEIDFPPLWVGVIGSDGYWPVQQFGSEPQLWFRAINKSVPAGTPALKIATFLPGAPTKIWAVISILICSFGLFHCLAVLIGMSSERQSCLWKNKLHDKFWMEFLIVDAGSTVGRATKEEQEENRRRNPIRALFLFLATSAVLMAQVIALIPWFLLVSLGSHLRLAAALGMGIGCVLVSLVTLASLPRYVVSGERRFNLLRIVAIIVIGGITLLTLIYWTRKSIAPLAGIEFSQRSVSPLSGVAPSLPLLLALGGIYLYGFLQVRRITFVENRNPGMPTRAFSQVHGIALERVHDEVECAVGRSLLPRWRIIYLGMGALVAGLIATHLSPRSFEGWWYDGNFYVLEFFLWLFVAYTWWRFILTWWAFRKLLRRLERIPLRYAFSRIPRTFSWSPIWQNGGMKRSYLVQCRSLEYLRCISTTPDELPRSVGALAVAPRPEYVLQDSIREAQAGLDCVFARETDDYRVTASQSAGIRHPFDEAAEQVAPMVNQWLTKGGADASDAEMRRRNDLPCTETFKNHEAKVLTAEFLALRFVGYLRYVSLHMRNQLTFVSLGFVFALLALKSYPFQQRQTISWILVAMFGILCIGIVRVFADMDRDAILSRISNTKAGKLDSQFFIRIMAFGTLPLITILASQFPSISNFLFSWVRPGLEVLK